jgi:phytoene/squalene synthetase
MTNTPSTLRSGKGHRDENFPVASRLIAPRHRGIILAFYEFVRVADDMADHPTLKADEKLALLDRLEAGLLGTHDEISEATALRAALRERNLALRHAQDLLTAFRMDVTKLRYRDWDDLMNYCTYSAMPANDALCAALQIINHLQDCHADYRTLDRVYVPLDALAATGSSVDDLGREASSPALRQCLRNLAVRTGSLLDEAAPFSSRIRDFRLAMEVSVIHALARRLVAMLAMRDPLSERVHLKAPGVAAIGVLGLVVGAIGRVGRVLSASDKKPRNA